MLGKAARMITLESKIWRMNPTATEFHPWKSAARNGIVSLFHPFPPPHSPTPIPALAVQGAGDGKSNSQQPIRVANRHPLMKSLHLPATIIATLLTIGQTSLAPAKLRAGAETKSEPRTPAQPVAQTPPTVPAPPAGAPPTSPVSTPGTASPIAPLTQTREATVRCVWFRGGSEGVPAAGGSSPVTIRVAPNPSGGTPVAIAEDFVNSSGEMWRAASWIAAFCASHVCDTLITDYEFVVKAGGFIDGPSAGMLITTTMASLIRGDKLLPATTMTGTVNPDGSAGPVGGIVQKMEGAKKDGIKRFGFPMGCRICQDVNTREPVDLIEKARDMGIEAREIGDVYDAYTFMTGKTLLRYSPVDEAKMQIPIGVALRLRGAVSSLRNQAARNIAELKRSFADLPKGKLEAQTAELGPAESFLARSEMSERDGNLSLSFSFAQRADGLARYAKLLYEMGRHVTRGDLASYMKVGTDQGNSTLNSLDGLRMSLKSGVERATIGGKVDALHSYMIYWQGRAMAQSGIETYKSLKRSEKELATAIKERADMEASASKKPRAGTPTAKSGEEATRVAKALKNYVELSEEATGRFAFAECRAQAAEKWSNFAQEGGREVKASQELYEKLGRAYSTAAAAGLGWFQAMVLKDSAQSMGVRDEDVYRYMLTYDADYAPIHCATQFAMSSAAAGSKESLAPIDQLASGVFAYHGAASLINKRYNFRVLAGSEKAGRMELTHRKALGHALDLARRRVLEEAARVEEIAGFIPDSVKLNYDLANVLRDGSDQDKLNALTSYWTCVFLCDLTRQLARGN